VTRADARLKRPAADPPWPSAAASPHTPAGTLRTREPPLAARTRSANTEDPAGPAPPTHPKPSYPHDTASVTPASIIVNTSVFLSYMRKTHLAAAPETHGPAAGGLPGTERLEPPWNRLR